MKNKLVFNYLMDLKKLKIDEFERAQIIKQFIDENNLSQRELSRRLKIPKSTVEDWLIYNRVTEKKYKEMKSNGLSKTDIRDILRKDKKRKLPESKLNMTSLDINLIEAAKLLRPFILEPKSSPETLNLINELRNLLNRTEMHIERRRKKSDI